MTTIGMQRMDAQDCQTMATRLQSSDDPCLRGILAGLQEKEEILSK